MKKFILCAALLALGASAADADGWINRVPVEKLIPPPPPRGSAIERAEIAEIHKAQANASPAAMAAAKYDSDVEDPTIFAGAIGPGWDLTKLPKTKFLMDRVMDVDRPDSASAKKFFHRARPWIVDPSIQTCAQHEPGPQMESYPSGHSMLGYELGVVLAALMPNHAKAILARAHLYGENRIVCGFHYRSDVEAGDKYGTDLANEMMAHPVFHAWFNQSRAELVAAGLTH